MLLPGRNASTPMWLGNIPAILEHRSIICADLLWRGGHVRTGQGDYRARRRGAVAGRDVGGARAGQGAPDGCFDSRRLDCGQLRRPSSWPGRLVGPAGSGVHFRADRGEGSAGLAGSGVVPGVPAALRSRVLSWISGGADVDGPLPVAALISAGSTASTCCVRRCPR